MNAWHLAVIFVAFFGFFGCSSPNKPNLICKSLANASCIEQADEIIKNCKDYKIEIDFPVGGIRYDITDAGNTCKINAHLASGTKYFCLYDKNETQQVSSMGFFDITHCSTE